jgi:hypothetical protein
MADISLVAQKLNIRNQNIIEKAQEYYRLSRAKSSSVWPEVGNELPC